MRSNEQMGDPPRPERIVDAHVHLWDPARTDWYPYLSGRQDVGLGDVSGMARRFDLATHRSESTGWNVVKLVNVAAATGVHAVEETLALEAAADRGEGPDAIIGGITTTGSIADAIEQLDQQSASHRFRGVRPMGGSRDPVPPPEVLRALADRGLVFELLAHPDQHVEAAEALASVEDLVVVIEHAGWPRRDTEDERAQWLTGMRALAELGDRVACKLSGLAMPLGTIDPVAFAPWVEPLLELFGPDRCMFASNFPVDGMHGSFDSLYTAYAILAADLDVGDREALFATTAERFLRC